MKSIDIVECAIEGKFKSPVMNKRLLEKKTNDKVESSSNNVINLIQFEQNIKRNNNNNHSSLNESASKYINSK